MRYDRIKACGASVIFAILIALISTGRVQSEEGVLNQVCNTKQDCGAFGYICGRNGTCWCAHSFIQSKSGERCVGGVGQKCKYDDHCIEGAFCEHQVKCMCKDNFYPENDGLSCSSSSRISIDKSPFFYAATGTFYLINMKSRL